MGRSVRGLILLIAVGLAGLAPAFAQAADPAAKSGGTLALLLTWSPMILFLGYFWFVLRKQSVPASRVIAHMERVEQSLERLVKAAEGPDRKP